MKRKIRSREPLQNDNRGLRIITHGTGGWHGGCGCDTCTTAHAGQPITSHGPDGYTQGCSCEICVTAHDTARTAKRSTTRKLPAGEARLNFKSGAFSDTELALLDEAAARAGITRSEYIREAVVFAAAGDLNMTDEELAALDTARRPAPRQRGRKQREDATG